MIAYVLLTTALTVAVAIVWQLAATLTAANRLTAAQRRRIELLEHAITQQQERIGWYIEANGELEDRNACLERIQRKNLYNAVVSMPVMDGAEALGRALEIGMN